jgi:hypothetical protein
MFQIIFDVFSHEKKKLDARTVEKVGTESEERARKFVEQKRAREENTRSWQRKLRNLFLGELGPGRQSARAKRCQPQFWLFVGRQ